ncbi:MAG: DNA topoisomerase 4 subunit A [Hyphomicrobiaceae bacterium hypho_1]
MSNKFVSKDDCPFKSVDLREALEERYLAYALSTIMHRALPDVRDGLKPVHRRIIFAMRELRLNPDQAYKKCAKIVGEVMGNFHPHGDQAIYDALVRLAQCFAVRYPLVDGQGNFGNIDGDNAAAMRYTESRMTHTALALLDGIDQDTVDFRLTYDASCEEPVVLPSAFPNLLANGSSGIAVGMATNIPPHNVEEICNALLYLIKHPDASLEKIVEYIPAPDFPTGGIIIESRANIIEAYKTGRGGFRLRAKWMKEDTGRGGYQIAIIEIPYQVQKSKLLEKLADLIVERKLPLVGDVRDESAEDIRLIIEPKSRAVDPIVMMESLFKLSELEIRFGLNMNVLSAGQVPNVLDLRSVLQQWLDHRMVVLKRRSQFRLKKIKLRLEILEGYLAAFLNIDEVIRIIRFEDEPKGKLIILFKLSDIQAEAILNLRLRALSKIEEVEIRAEHDHLNNEQRKLLELLQSKDLKWAKISEEISEIKKEYSHETEIGARRTQLAEAPEIEIDLEQAMIEKEPITVILSDKGWLRALKGHQSDFSRFEFKQGDRLRIALRAFTTDRLLIFTSNGRFYTLSCDQLRGGRGHGEPVRLMIDLEEDFDVVNIFIHRPERRLLIGSKSGYGFIVCEDDIVASTRKGKQILKLVSSDVAEVCVPVNGDMVATVSDNGKLLVFALSEVNMMTRGKGVILQRLKGDALSDIRVFDSKYGLMWLNPEGQKTILTFKELENWFGLRAQAGKVVPKGFPSSNKFGPAF